MTMRAINAFTINPLEIRYMNKQNETYKSITIDGLGVINLDNDYIRLTHEGGGAEIPYESYLGELYVTREDEIENYVKASSYSHYEALVTDKVVETLCTMEKELHDLVENTVWHYYYNDQKLVDESEETFDREKAIKEAEKKIQPGDIVELNRRTAYDLLETDPGDVIDYCRKNLGGLF